MSRSKVSILSKYVMAIAILALLFSVSLTTARYALNQSATIGVDIDSFDVDVSLYHDLGDGTREQVTGDINLDTNVESLSDYNEVYYLDISNGDNEILYYKIEEQSGNFCFKVGDDTTRYTTYGDSVTANSSIELTLTMSIHPDVTITQGETTSLSIKLYAEYQHTEVYESTIVEEPEPEPEDANHASSDWYYLSNSNVSGANLDTQGNYCLIEDVELTSSMTISADITLCLNGYTLTAASGYNPTQLINITSGSVTIEDCQGTGSINGGSLTQAISLSGSSANLTLTTSSITGGDYNVAISNGATLNLNGATLTSGNTGSVNISNGTFNLVSGTLNGNSKTGVNVGSSASFNMTGGLITGASNGVATTNGAKVNISGGSITSCTNAGIDLANGATLTLSGTPNISSNSSRNVYLELGALISLGELTSGANIGVTSATSTGQISTSEIDANTHYYESAINYIHSDNSSYKVSGRNSGYLSLIESSQINFSVALESTTTATGPSFSTGTDYDGTIKIDGGEGSTFKGSSWAGQNANYEIARSMSSYSNGSYSYNYFFSFGGISTTADFTFALSPYKWYSDLGTSGIATSNFWPKFTANNYYFWANQSDSGNDWSTDASWGFTFTSNEDGGSVTSSLQALSDFTVVLQLDYSQLSITWNEKNSVVTGAYLLLDGTKSSIEAW